jgi:hypothetical protein
MKEKSSGSKDKNSGAMDSRPRMLDGYIVDFVFFDVMIVMLSLGYLCKLGIHVSGLYGCSMLRSYEDLLVPGECSCFGSTPSFRNVRCIIIIEVQHVHV